MMFYYYGCVVVDPIPISATQAQDKSSDVITDNNAAAKDTNEVATTQLLDNLLQTVTRATPEPDTPGRVT